MQTRFFYRKDKFVLTMLSLAAGLLRQQDRVVRAEESRLGRQRRVSATTPLTHDFAGPLVLASSFSRDLHTAHELPAFQMSEESATESAGICKNWSGVRGRRGVK
jgi:hypothetical protein